MLKTSKIFRTLKRDTFNLQVGWKNNLLQKCFMTSNSNSNSILIWVNPNIMKNLHHFSIITKENLIFINVW